MTKSFEKLYSNKNDYIAYKAQLYHKNKKSIIWFGGLNSDMEGTKAKYLSNFSKKNQINFCRFDYFGHGKSSKEFQDCTITDWLDNGIKIIDSVFKGPIILIGSSMGGWVSLLASLKRKKRIKGIVLIAPAVDMTERLMLKSFSPKEKKEIKSKGYIDRFTEGYDESYRITNKLLEDGKKHLILNKQINITIPIKIFHGMRDNSVPWKLSLELLESLKSNNVDIHLIKNGDHSLSSKKDLSALGSNILDYYE